MLDKNPDVKKPEKIKKAGLHAANATFLLVTNLGQWPPHESVLVNQFRLGFLQGDFLTAPHPLFSIKIEKCHGANQSCYSKKSFI